MPAQLSPMRQDLGSQAHQGIDLHPRSLARARTLRGCKLQRAHAPRPRVAEPVHGAKTRRGSPLRGEPGIDQGIAKLVRQRVRQQSRQTVKGVARQRGKFIDVLAQRHGQRRNLDSAPGKRRVVLEGGVIAPFFHRNGADGAPPELDLGNHDGSPQVHSFGSADAAFRPVARCRWRPCSFHCAMGLIGASGMSDSKRSTKPRTRQTLTKPESCVAAAAQFQPLHGPQPKTRLLCELCLSQVLRQAEPSQAFSDQVEKPFIGRSRFDLHTRLMWRIKLFIPN